MTGRIILAALAATVAMFIWMSVAHMSPLGMVGLKTFANDAPVISALKDAAGNQAGLYVVPTAGMEGKGAPGPTGFIIYSPDNAPGMDEMTPMMVSEFVIELVQVTILAFLLVYAKVNGFTCRVAAAAGVGAMVAISTNFSYLIWYGYPIDYTLANAAIQFIAYTIAGLVLGKMLPRNDGATA